MGLNINPSVPSAEATAGLEGDLEDALRARAHFIESLPIQNGRRVFAVEHGGKVVPSDVICREWDRLTRAVLAAGGVSW